MEMMPRLEEREVEALFTARLEDFLRKSLPEEEDEGEKDENQDCDGRDSDSEPAEKKGEEKEKIPWYSSPGTTTGPFHTEPWRIHVFRVPARPPNTPPHPPRIRRHPSSSSSSITPYPPRREVAPPAGEGTGAGHFRVFGLTAKILVDVARVAFGPALVPEFEHNAELGDERMIWRMIEAGEGFEDEKAKRKNVEKAEEGERKGEVEESKL